MKTILKGILSLFEKQSQDFPEDNWSSKIVNFENNINYSFKNKKLIKAALTHSSFLRENKNNSSVAASERMEFLGDSILGLIVAEFLFTKYPHDAEGKLSKLKSKIVSEKFLAQRAKQINLGEYIIMSKDEAESGGAGKKSILSDLMESLICAIYLDSGISNARKFISNFILQNYESHIKHDSLVNYKSKLQEYTQSKYQIPPQYKTIAEEGPDHLKEFTVEVYINNELFGTGKGKSKKEAQQNAAKEACTKIGI